MQKRQLIQNSNSPAVKWASQQSKPKKCYPITYFSLFCHVLTVKRYFHYTYCDEEIVCDALRTLYVHGH